MKKISLFVFALLVSILFIGCDSGNNEDNTEAVGDWPVYDIEELMEKVDLIAFVTVESIQELTQGEGQDRLDRKVSNLRINDIAYTETQNTEASIELNQAVNFVELDKSYLLFLNKRGDYYYVADGNSVIPEKDNMYQVNVTGIEGEYEKEQFSKRIEEKVNKFSG